MPEASVIPGIAIAGHPMFAAVSLREEQMIGSVETW